MNDVPEPLRFGDEPGNTGRVRDAVEKFRRRMPWHVRVARRVYEGGCARETQPGCVAGRPARPVVSWDTLAECTVAVAHGEATRQSRDGAIGAPGQGLRPQEGTTKPQRPKPVTDGIPRNSLIATNPRGASGTNKQFWAHRGLRGLCPECVVDNVGSVTRLTPYSHE